MIQGEGGAPWEWPGSQPPDIPSPEVPLQRLRFSCGFDFVHTLQSLARAVWPSGMSVALSTSGGEIWGAPASDAKLPSLQAALGAMQSAAMASATAERDVLSATRGLEHQLKQWDADLAVARPFVASFDPATFDVTSVTKVPTFTKL